MAMRPGRCSNRPATKCEVTGDNWSGLVSEGIRFVPSLVCRLRWRCVPLPEERQRNEGGEGRERMKEILMRGLNLVGVHAGLGPLSKGGGGLISFFISILCFYHSENMYWVTLNEKMNF